MAASGLTPGLVVVSLAILLTAESFFPLRRLTEPRPPRLRRNLVMALLGFPLVGLAQAPLLAALCAWTAQHHVGLLNVQVLPTWLAIAGTVVLMDYTLWHWHWLNHRMPLLWRFHLVHHVDRDLDVSTALRFHAGELLLSIPYRSLQIVAIGAHPVGYVLWQALLFAAILFHHSNLRLPAAFERWLVKVVVTPRMHGIHHSDRENETNSNWSSLLSAWDYLHGTAVLNVPQRTVQIGVPAYQHGPPLPVRELLVLPFRPQRADWLDPTGIVRRRALPGKSATLRE
jgi:sterol desaturase/sphingolipid hydroxylase (fatty acid hydroxylase superfamily)